MSKPPSQPRVRWLDVDAAHAGQRLDNFLLGALKGVPRSHIYRIVRSGEVRINRGRVRPGYRLRAGDRVRIPPLRQGEPGPRPGGPVRVPPILYEDDHLLILDKPAGEPVHGGSGHAEGVIERLRRARPEASFLELVHRLDRDTSGCLLVAKDRATLLALHGMLRAAAGTKAMRREYRALLAGRWAGPGRRVAAPLAKNRLRGGERVAMVDGDGVRAVTDFEPLRRFDRVTLVRARLLTGRTHQVRVHAAHIGHPVLGDEKYGNRDANRWGRERGLRRLFLHAEGLSLPHPAGGGRLEIHAPLPRDLEAFLQTLS